MTPKVPDPRKGKNGRPQRDQAHTAAMAAWKDVEQAEPEFAARVRRLFDAGRHKTIATLRADGSPRISGIECEFADGELRFGSMPGARKGADLRRDPRFALHILFSPWLLVAIAILAWIKFRPRRSRP